MRGESESVPRVLAAPPARRSITAGGKSAKLTDIARTRLLESVGREYSEIQRYGSESANESGAREGAKTELHRREIKRCSKITSILTAPNRHLRSYPCHKHITTI